MKALPPQIVRALKVSNVSVALQYAIQIVSACSCMRAEGSAGVCSRWGVVCRRAGRPSLCLWTLDRGHDREESSKAGCRMAEEASCTSRRSGATTTRKVLHWPRRARDTLLQLNRASSRKMSPSDLLTRANQSTVVAPARPTLIKPSGPLWGARELSSGGPLLWVFSSLDSTYIKFCSPEHFPNSSIQCRRRKVQTSTHRSGLDACYSSA